MNNFSWWRRETLGFYLTYLIQSESVPVGITHILIHSFCQPQRWESQVLHGSGIFFLQASAAWQRARVMCQMYLYTRSVRFRVPIGVHRSSLIFCIFPSKGWKCIHPAWRTDWFAEKELILSEPLVFRRINVYSSLFILHALHLCLNLAVYFKHKMDGQTLRICRNPKRGVNNKTRIHGSKDAQGFCRN
jgi:hypothetical protein